MKLILENWRQYLKEEDADLGLARFIVRSNEIEGYSVDLENAQFVIEKRGQELSDSDRYELKLANSPYIQSHLDGLEAAKKGHRSVSDIKNIHKAMGQEVLEQGQAGVLRTEPSEDVQSSHGFKYVPSEDVVEALSWWARQDWSDHFEGHTVYEMIHPFGDGNGRSGRIILAAMLGFDFSAANSMIGEDYFSKLEALNPKYTEKFWVQKEEEDETLI
jgi:Fic family protein